MVKNNKNAVQQDAYRPIWWRPLDVHTRGCTVWKGCTFQRAEEGAPYTGYLPGDVPSSRLVYRPRGVLGTPTPTTEGTWHQTYLNFKILPAQRRCNACAFLAMILTQLYPCLHTTSTTNGNCRLGQLKRCKTSMTSGSVSTASNTPGKSWYFAE